MKLKPNSSLEPNIFAVCGEKVVVDLDLARMYGVSNRHLNQAIKRNRDRFPQDFCFQLTDAEWDFLRSQIVTANVSKRRSLPWVFTEHGAVMAANVLRSGKAAQMSVFVVRAFIKMRTTLNETAVLAAKLIALEKEVASRLDSHEKAIVELMQRFLEILNPHIPEEAGKEQRREIGFHVKDRAKARNERRAR